MGIFNNKNATKFSRYIDPTGEFNNTQLEKAEWYAKHRLGIRKGIIIVLSVWCVISVGFSLFFWGKYIAFDVWQDQEQLARQTQEFQNFLLTKDTFTATPLSLGQTIIFQSNTNKYDFVTPATNLNERFLTRVTYQYQFAGTSTTPETVVIMPGQRVPISSLGIETGRGFPSGARLVILKQDWKRVSAHIIPNIKDYIQERQNIQVLDFVFEPDNKAEGRLSNQLRFDIKNDSVYNFWELPMYVEFLRGNNIAGVGFTTLIQFRGGETRTIDLRYVGDLPFIDSVRVTPIINIFDPSVYMNPGQ